MRKATDAVAFSSLISISIVANGEELFGTFPVD
jgi:hypothetical protein